MAYLRDLDVFTEVSRTGKYASKTAVDYSMWGVNIDVDTGTLPEDIWQYGGVFVPPTTYRLHNFASTSANDTAAGTGARTLTVEGVTTNGIESETLTMNGLASVSTVKSYSDLWFKVATAGSGLTNAGAITATAATDATVTAYLPTGVGNTTRKAIKLIPPGYTGYMYNFQGGMKQATASSFSDIDLLVKYPGGVWEVKSTHTISNSGNSVEIDEFLSPIELPTGTWIKAQCTGVTNNNTTVQARCFILLIAN
jgi:hypothetical protein